MDSQHHIRLSSIVSVCLRLAAIYWGIFGIVSISTAVSLVEMKRGISPANLMTYLPLAIPGVYLLFAALAWVFARPISLRVIGGPDPELPFPDVEVAHLYTFGLLIVGLYLFLEHLGGCLNWLYYCIISGSMEKILQRQTETNYYDAAAQIIPCIAGAVAVLTSPHFGRKLARARPAPEPSL